MYQFSTKCKSRKDALQVEGAKRHELALARIGIKPKELAPTLRAACDGFLQKVAVERTPQTVRRYDANIKSILKFFGSNTLCDKIAPENIEKFKQRLATQKSPKTKRKLQPVTINHILATLRMVFNRLVNLDVLPKSPARNVRALSNELKPPRILSFEEQKVYLMACAQPLRDVAVVMVELGLRPSEVLNLEHNDISLAENFLQVQKGKTKNARRKLPLSIESRKALEYRIQTSKGENLFPDTTISELDYLHSKALKALNIKLFTDDYFVLYSLRHSFASRHTENQTDPVTLAEMLGHGDLKTLKRYAHPSFEHKAEAITRVEKKAKAV